MHRERTREHAASPDQPIPETTPATPQEPPGKRDRPPTPSGTEKRIVPPLTRRRRNHRNRNIPRLSAAPPRRNVLNPPCDATAPRSGGTG